MSHVGMLECIRCGVPKHKIIRAFYVAHLIRTQNISIGLIQDDSPPNYRIRIIIEPYTHTHYTHHTAKIKCAKKLITNV